MADLQLAGADSVWVSIHKADGLPLAIACYARSTDFV
jgi:hypothetical protein